MVGETRVPVIASSCSLVDLSACVEEARIAHRKLETWLIGEESRTLALDGVEREMTRRGREVLRLMLESHLRARGTGNVGLALFVRGASTDGPEGRVEVHSHRRRQGRTIETVVGSVAVERTGYGGPGLQSIRPLDEAAAFPDRRYSYELQRGTVVAAIQGPFDEAVARTAEATGVVLPKRSAELLVRDAARDFEAFYAQREAKPACETGPILVSAVDCKGIPMVKPEKALRTPRRKKGQKANKKRMATVAAVFTQEPRVRTPESVVASLFDESAPDSDDQSPGSRPRPQNKRVWASVATSKDEVLAEVSAEVERRDPEAVKRRVGLTDGERALQRRIKGAVAGLILILDLLHVLEKLWKAAYCFHAEGSDEAVAWVRERCLRILRGQVSQVVKGIGKSATARGFSGKARETIDAVRGYLYRNRAHMRYHEYLKEGLPIASGAVEGACRNLIKDRMERSGMRWTIESAEALVKLRAVYLSDDLEAYWRFHVAADQERLHPKGRWSVSDK